MTFFGFIIINLFCHASVNFKIIISHCSSLIYRNKIDLFLHAPFQAILAFSTLNFQECPNHYSDFFFLFLKVGVNLFLEFIYF